MSQSLDRALQLLWDVAESPKTIRALAERLAVHPTTALRLVQSLQERRMVERQANGEYRLGSGVLELGQRAAERIDIRAVAAPHMRELGRATGETVHLAVLAADNVVYVDKVDSVHPVRMYSRIGIVAPLHCTGVAKAFLAFLDDEERERLIARTPLERYNDRTLTTADALRADLTLSRERGYAIDAEEHETGIHCVAAPVLNADGTVAGSMSVSAPTSRVGRDALLAFVPPLLEAARRSSAGLGYAPC